jgi:hypothetical protein
MAFAPEGALWLALGRRPERLPIRRVGGAGDWLTWRISALAADRLGLGASGDRPARGPRRSRRS